jgi:hypothetical protein
MAIRMQTPWKNPRSENLWFMRRVPAALVDFMGDADRFVLPEALDGKVDAKEMFDRYAKSVAIPRRA